MPLNGYDIANVNGPNIINTALNGDFVVCKITEGIGFVDQYAQGWLSRAQGAGKLTGGYHYAHLANGGTAEANFFLAHLNWTAGMLPCLDFEPYGQSIPDSSFPQYILDFKRTVAATTIVPPIYLNDDMGNRVFANASPAEAAEIRTMPLWKAGLSNGYPQNADSGPGNTFGFNTVLMFQWGDRGIDSDRAFVDQAGWVALGSGGDAGLFSALSDQEQQEILGLVRDTHLRIRGNTASTVLTPAMALAHYGMHPTLTEIPPGHTPPEGVPEYGTARMGAWASHPELPAS